MHPIYKFIRTFHFQVETVIQDALQSRMNRMTLLSVYLLLLQILKQVPEKQRIKKCKNQLQLKTYKNSLRQWMFDWIIGSAILNEKVSSICWLEVRACFVVCVVTERYYSVYR